ncbi:MAG TPA: 4'-phosphopantetheinyl transferase superfamily protein [Puia sp.]|jgi:4'-phosphopantetheinyl transferase|nr:4'-phosphopantetheinyl transferase superfamily protein [Puia sp.]
MLNIYSIDYLDQVAPETFRSLLSRLPDVFRIKVQRYRRWQDAYGSLFGKLLLRLALQRAGLSGELGTLRFNDYGKPFLENGPEFNLSHSGNRVVCVLSGQGRVGIDLEAVSDLAIDDFQTQFTPAEWSRITGSATPLYTFYRYWTAKESLIKADGRGLQIPLDQLVVGDAGETEGIALNENRWYIRELDAFPGYACHIACETTPFQVNIETLTWKDVEGWSY